MTSSKRKSERATHEKFNRVPKPWELPRENKDLRKYIKEDED